MKRPNVEPGSWKSKILFKAFTSKECENFLDKHKLTSALIQECIFSGLFFVTCYHCRECKDLMRHPRSMFLYNESTMEVPK